MIINKNCIDDESTRRQRYSIHAYVYAITMCMFYVPWRVIFHIKLPTKLNTKLWIDLRFKLNERTQRIFTFFYRYTHDVLAFNPNLGISITFMSLTNWCWCLVWWPNNGHQEITIFWEIYRVIDIFYNKQS